MKHLFNFFYCCIQCIVGFSFISAILCRNGGGFYYDNCEILDNTFDTSDCFISLDSDVTRALYDSNKAWGEEKTPIHQFNF
jgi:hypothetical protein